MQIMIADFMKQNPDKDPFFRELVDKLTNDFKSQKQSETEKAKSQTTELQNQTPSPLETQPSLPQQNTLPSPQNTTPSQQSSLPSQQNSLPSQQNSPPSLFRLLLQTSGERSFTILWTLLSSCYIYGCSSNGENSIYRCNNTCLCRTGGARSSEAETMEHRPIGVHQDKYKKIVCINLETWNAWKYNSRNSSV